MGYITESEKKVNVIGDYDVAVAGGGVAGIAAALASARQGKKTVLIEKQFALGGLGTLGLITIYLPLCDGCGNQVSFGIAEELLKLSVKHGYEEQFFEERNYTDECFKTWLETGKNESGSNQRYQVRYNANVFAILCEQLLIENGVEILYGTSVCDVIMNNDKISHLLIENKSGNCLVVVRLGQIESEHLVDAFDLETGRKEVGVILGLFCDIFVGVVLVFDFPEEFLYDVFQ